MAEIEPIEAEWNALTQDVPFRSFQWASSWWRHYRQPGMQLFVLAVRDDQGQLIGLAPWYLGRDKPYWRSLSRGHGVSGIL